MKITKITIMLIIILLLGSGGLLSYFSTIESHDNECPKGFTNLNKIELLKINQSITQVYELLGEPYESSGSGYHYCTYKLEDGNYQELRLVFKGYLEEAYLIDNSGTQMLVSLETLSEDEIEKNKIVVPNL